ncbi:secernin-1 [Gastrophryne carolinensis]
MTGAPPSFCFVAFAPRSKKSCILFGKNSARPRDEVQEVLFVSSASHDPGSKVQCTYLEIDQAAQTHSVILSKPTWMWGAEMGANEHSVCIGNVALTTKLPAEDTKLLLGMDLVRLGLERGKNAKEALDVIVSLLEQHGQGGSYFHSGDQGFQSAFLIVDRFEAWVLETVGKFWAAKKITDGVTYICNHLSLKTKLDLEHPGLRNYAKSHGWWSEDKEFNFSEAFSGQDSGHHCLEAFENQDDSITLESAIKVLRNKAKGICVDSDTFLTTASALSALPQEEKLPCIHFLTGTPDPSRSVFKPFIFVEGVSAVSKTQSSCAGENNHELYEAHQCALSLMNDKKEEGETLLHTMLNLEKQGLDAMEDILNGSSLLDPVEAVDLFYDCVDTEIKFYK